MFDIDNYEKVKSEIIEKIKDKASLLMGYLTLEYIVNKN